MFFFIVFLSEKRLVFFQEKCLLLLVCENLTCTLIISMVHNIVQFCYSFCLKVLPTVSSLFFLALNHICLQGIDNLQCGVFPRLYTLEVWQVLRLNNVISVIPYM